MQMSFRVKVQRRRTRIIEIWKFNIEEHTTTKQQQLTHYTAIHLQRNRVRSGAIKLAHDFRYDLTNINYSQTSRSH